MYQTVEQYAEELSNCRISTKTRSKYNNKQAKMLQWLIDNYPFYVDRSSQPAKHPSFALFLSPSLAQLLSP
jgi:hypothetical protein